MNLRNIYRVALSRDRAPRLVSIVAGALLAAWASTFLIGRTSVEVQLDLLPEPNVPAYLEFTPNENPIDSSMLQPIKHEKMAGGQLRLELTARGQEHNVLILSLMYERKDGGGKVTLQGRAHPGNGELTTTVMIANITPDIDPDTLQVGVHLMKRATLPVQISNISARLSNPPWPGLPPAMRDDSNRISGIELIGDNWEGPEGQIQIIEGDATGIGERAPTLTWGNRSKDSVEMKLLSDSDDSSIPSYYEFSLSSLSKEIEKGDARSLSDYSHAYVEIRPSEIPEDFDFRPRFDPIDSWLEHEWEGATVFVNDRQNATLHWARWLPGNVSLRLIKTPHGGPTILRTREQVQYFDLRTDSEDEYIDVPIEPLAKIRRYHAVVPRNALSHLKVANAGAPFPLIQRVTLGTHPNQTVFMDEPIGAPPDGEVYKDWYPRIIDSKVPLPSLAPWEHGGWATFGIAFGGFLILFSSKAAYNYVAPRALQISKTRGRALAKWTHDSHPIRRARVHSRSAWNATREILTPKMVVAISVASALLAAWLTFQIRDLPVAIGLDLASEPGQPPRLVDAENNLLHEMAAITSQFSPSTTAYQIRATGKRNPKSKGTEVRFRTEPPTLEMNEAFHTQPPLYWGFNEGNIISYGETSTSLSYEGAGGPITLEFNTNDAAGIIDIETQTGIQRYDLYSEEEGVTRVEVSALPSSRYYGSIPRGNLHDFAFQIAQNTVVDRIYIGTLLPRIFFQAKPYPIGAWGKITTNWEPYRTENRLQLEETFAIERGGVLTFLILTALTALAGLILILVLTISLRGCKKLLSLPPPPERRLHKNNIAIALGMFLVFASVFSFYLLTYYPAIQVGDTRHQWEQITTDTLKDDHPLLSTLTLKYIRAVWDSWTAVAIVQIVALAGSLTLAFSLLLRAGVPRFPILVAFLLACISPRIATHAVTIWKDTPYSILVFLLTIGISLYFLNDKVRKSAVYWAVLGILLGLIPLFRHNGLAVLGAMAVLLPFALTSHRKYCLIASIIGISIFAIAKLVIYPPILSEMNLVSGVPNFWARHKNLSNTRYFLAQDPPLQQSDYDFFTEMALLFPEDKERLYSTGDFTKYRNDRNLPNRIALIDEGKLNVAILRLDTLRKANPLLSFRCIWWEDHEDRIRFLVGRADRIRLGLFVPSRRANQFGGNATQLLHARLKKIRVNRSFLYSQPTISFYGVMLAMCILIYRKRDIRYGLIYAPVLANSLALVIVAAGTSDRYHFPLELASGYLICLAFMPRTRGKELHPDVPHATAPAV